MILNETFIPKLSLPFSEDSNYYYPTITIKDEEILQTEVERLKNITDLYESFEIGLYEGGKIDLGYSNEVTELEP